MLQPDTLLNGRYRIVRLIGQGGMGAVYEATDERLRSRVALKQTTVVGEQFSKAFEREAQLLAGLRHAALPRVIDHFVEPAGQFLVMEFIPGQDLAGTLHERAAPFPVAEVLRWAEQLLDALDYLHTQTPPIIHRDIKPQNLKLTPRGEMVLLDFGLAKGSAALATQAAQSVSLFGYTPQYAPLEQIQGTGTDPRSDLYSLAATLYHLLTNQTPANALDRATAVLNGAPDPLRPANEINGEVTPLLAAVLGQALALRADERFRTALAFRQALRQSSDVPPLPPPHVATGPTVVAARPDEARPVAEQYAPTRASLPKPPPAPPASLPVERVSDSVLRLPADTPPTPARRNSPVRNLLLLGGAVLAMLGIAIALIGGRREPNSDALNDTGTAIAILDPFAEGDEPPGELPPAQPIALDPQAIIKGSIDSPGEHDVYGFDVEPDQQIFLWTVSADDDMSQIDLRLLDANDDEVANQCLGCGNLGTVPLERGGAYRLVVGDNSDAGTGDYELRVNLIPAPAEFAVPLDVRIAEDAPGPGAAEIAVPGAKNVFSFEAAENQQLFVWTVRYDEGMEQIDLQLLDADDDEVARQCMGCGNLGMVTLREAGSYRLVVGDETDPATGRYEVRLNVVPPPTELEVGIPASIGNNAPGPGAGTIDKPGAKQVFRFEAQPGQQVFVRTVRYDNGMEQLDVRVLDANDDEVKASCLGCGDLGLLELRKGGTYRVVVGDDKEAATGEYEIELTSPE